MSFDLRIIEGDIGLPDDLDATGNSELENLVEGYKKAYQDLHKILLSPIGESRYHPGYGSALSYLSYTDNEPVEIASQVEEDVYRAISNLIALQKYQMQNQLIDAEEMILEVNSVDVFFDSQDPRLLNVLVKVTLGNLTELPASITVQITGTRFGVS